MSRPSDTASQLAEGSAHICPHYILKASYPPLIWGNSLRVLCMTGGGPLPARRCWSTTLDESRSREDSHVGAASKARYPEYPQ